MEIQSNFRASTKKEGPLFTRDFWFGLIFGTIGLGGTFAIMISLISGILTGVILGLIWFSIWMIFAYRDMNSRHEAAASLCHNIYNARCQIETAYKETEAAYETSVVMINKLLNEVSNMQTELDGSKTKDALIDALKRRVANISAEYNDKHSGNRVVTLGDVYKLTGEI